LLFAEKKDEEGDGRYLFGSGTSFSLRYELSFLVSFLAFLYGYFSSAFSIDIPRFESI
jgi:hypothetical protein